MSDMHLGLQAIAHEPANHPIVTRFIRFFLAVAVIPVLVYVLVLRLTPNTFALSPPITAGIAAVLALNAITSLFALLAVREKSPQPNDDDQTHQVVAEQQEQEEHTIRPKDE